MAGILLLHEHEHEHEHESWHLTAVLPTYTVLPYNRQDLAPLRLRNDPDNPSCRYAYNPDLLTSLVPICLRAEHD